MQFFESLTRIAAAINSSLELEDVLSLLCREVTQFFHIEGAAIHIFDVAALELVLRASNGIDIEGIDRLPLQDTSHFLVNAFFTGKPVTLNSGGNAIPAPFRSYGFHSMLSMPLIRGERGLGVLLLASKEAERFVPEDLERARVLADHAAIAVNNAILFEKEKHKSQQLGLAIQEAHHRIKNNLQTVSVLLSLQMGSCDEPQAKLALSDSINRINAISIVHELLSVDSDIRLIDCRELLGKLMHQVTNTTNLPGRQIMVTLDAENVLISSRRATSLALIAQELVSNALEHGMAGRNEGTVEVSLHRSGNTVTFNVKDNGVGLPESFDDKHDVRIGLEVVRTLAEKELGGTIRFSKCDPGLLVTLNFNDAGITADV